MISVIIPVYKDSLVLEENLRKLLKEPVDKEIIIVADEPTPHLRKILKKKKIKTIFNSKRVGKARALNMGIKMAKGDILVFLDADVRIQTPFLSIIQEEMRDVEIIDMKKLGEEDGFLGKMLKYELLGMNIYGYLFSKMLGRCLGIMGSGVALRKSVLRKVGKFRRYVAEDLDFSLRAFVKKIRGKFCSDVCLRLIPKKDFRSWLKQRRRWGYGCGEWARDHWDFVKRYPHLIMLASFLLFPFLVPFFLLQIFSPTITKLVHMSLLMFLLHFPTLAPVFPVALGISFIKSLISAIISFLSFSLLYWIFGKKFGTNFNLAEFFVYFFLYQPVYFLVFLNGMYNGLRKKPMKMDWVV